MEQDDAEVLQLLVSVEQPERPNRVAEALQFAAGVCEVIGAIVLPRRPFIISNNQSHYRRGLRDSIPTVDERPNRSFRLGNMVTTVLGKTVDTMDWMEKKRKKGNK